MRTDAIRPGDVIADKYRVRAILSRSRGFLVEAFHTEFDQRVALRVLSPALCDEKEVERFRRESRILAKLESEHVARIVDVGTLPDGSFYFARQYLEGTDLASYIKQRGALPLAEAVNLILQAAEPVAETHVHNILLRELQPSHLFLTQRLGGAPLLKVIDFGTAKLIRDAVAPTAGDEMTATTMFGLSCYSSPELVRKAKHVDARTDIWSLGAIFYQLLTGRPPFEGEMAMLMLQITKENPVPVSQRRRDLPREIDQIIGWAMAKDVDGRFANIHAFAHALSPYASAEGQVLIQRIGEITRAAKQRKQTSSAAMDRDHPITMDGNDLLEDEDTSEATRIQSSSYLAAQALPAASAPQQPQGQSLDSTMFIGPGFVPSSPAAQPAAGRAPMPSTPVFGGAAAGMPMPSRPGSQPPGPLLGPSLDLDPRGAGGFHGRAPMASDAGSTVPAMGAGAAGAPAFEAPKAKQGNQKVAIFAVMGAVVLLGGIGGVVAMSGGSDDKTATADSAAVSASAAVAAPPATTVAAVAPPPVTSEPATPPATAEPVAVAPTETAAPAAPVHTAASTSKGGSTTAPTHAATAAKPTATAKPTAAPPTPTPDSGGMGTLVAVAVGGTCSFSVNGASKGTTSSLRVQVKAGTYSVTCKPATGATKSKSVSVPSGGSAMAMFKLQ